MRPKYLWLGINEVIDTGIAFYDIFENRGLAVEYYSTMMDPSLFKEDVSGDLRAEDGSRRYYITQEHYYES